MKNKKKRNTQSEIILEHLMIHKTATTSEFNNLGVMAPAGPIYILKRIGWPIGKVMFNRPDHNGVMHKQAQYSLQKEMLTPEQQQILQETLAD